MSASIYCRYVKRSLDVVFASAALVLLAPLTAIAALVTYATMGRPVVFRQPRIGQGEKEFTILKFRTMSDACGRDGRPLPDFLRLSPIGRMLRATSLDELPQLWNILRGDMSFVGPRPLRVEYLPYYTKREQMRHLVRPGLTGLAQVSGRNALSWDDRLELDVQYVERHGFRLDCYIAVLTIGKVLGRSDISQPNDAYISLYDCRPIASDVSANRRAA